MLFQEDGGIATEAREESKTTLLLLCVIRGDHISWEGQNEHYLKKTATTERESRAILWLLTSQVQTSHISKIPNSL